MTEETIKEIIRRYSEQEVPDQVKESFEQWMLDSDDWAEKSDALEELWEEFSHETGSVAHGLPGAETVLKDAILEEKRISGRLPFVHKIYLWTASAAAVFFAVLSLFMYSVMGRTEVCLASSDGAKASFVLPDGSKVWLNRDSRLYYSGDMDGKERRVRLEGEGFFDVAKNPERPFIVSASDIDINVLGTEFTVSAYDAEKVDTYLLEGRVGISGPGIDGSIDLVPDQAVRYIKSDMSYRKYNVKASNHTSWINERLVFQNVSLSDIVETLSHWYNIVIFCPDENFANNTKLSFTVRQEPLCEILDAIEKLIPVSCHMTDSDRTIIINNN